MDLKIIQSLLERVQMHKNAGKPKDLCELEDVSEEQQIVELFRTNKGLITFDFNSIHTHTHTQLRIIQTTTQC